MCRNRTVFVSLVKTGVQIICNPMKTWIPAGVYPDENRGGNDVRQHQTHLFTASGWEGASQKRKGEGDGERTEEDTTLCLAS